MSDPRSRWSELLGIADDVRDPDLYQILGFERLGFDGTRLEERFRERMQKIQAVRSTKHKEFVEFVKGELRRARRVLADERERGLYDRSLVNERAQRLRRVLSPVLATGSLPPAAERAVEDEARRLGLTDDEARAAIEEELQRTGARRGTAAHMLADVAGLSPEEAAAVAASEAAELAKLAGAAAARALEAAREAEAARSRAHATARLRAAPTEPEVAREVAPAAPEREPGREAGREPATPAVATPRPSEAPPRPSELVARTTELVSRAAEPAPRATSSRRPPERVSAEEARAADEETHPAGVAPPETPRRKKKKRPGKKGRRSGSDESAALPPEEPAIERPTIERPKPEAPQGATDATTRSALKKSDQLAALQFCDRCGVSLPARWTKTGEAERVGVRLLCAACSAPVRAGLACAGCSSPTTEDDRLVSSAGTLRMCSTCARSTRRLKVCAGCQMILPRIAIERGEARSRQGQLYCAECLAAAPD